MKVGVPSFFSHSVARSDQTSLFEANWIFYCISFLVSPSHIFSFDRNCMLTKVNTKCSFWKYVLACFLICGFFKFRSHYCLHVLSSEKIHLGNRSFNLAHFIFCCYYCGSGTETIRHKTDKKLVQKYRGKETCCEKPSATICSPLISDF